MPFLQRFTNLFRTRVVDRDLDDEQRFHLEARIDALMADGMSREAARAEAQRRFGGRLRQREASRDIRLLPWLASLGRDARFGLRLLRRDAGVSTAAILSLGLAVGACTAAFSLIDALILRALPVRDPASLVAIERPLTGDDARFNMLTSYPFLERIREAAGSKLEVFSVSHQTLRQAILADADGAEEKVRAQFVSGNAFAVLGVRPALGRLLTAADDVTPGAHQVTVISHAFWQRRLGGRSDVVGQWLQFEQKPYQIVGVAQAGFTGTETGALTDLWVPNMMWNREALTQPQWNWLQIWGRLRPGVTADQVTPIVRLAAANLEDRHEGVAPKTDEQRRAEASLDVVSMARGSSILRRSFERPLWMLAAIICGLLLIACANVTNLLLARGAAREREMVLRASIGAGRARLLQQALVEAALLTVAALALGLLFARLATPVIVGMLTTNENPVYLETSLSVRAIVFVSGLGVLTTLIFGLAPALRASAASPGALAQTLSRVTSRTVMLRTLVSAQVAFSIAIVFVAGLLLRSFDRLLQVDLGFAPERLTLLTIEARERFEPAQARAVGEQLLERVRALTGVERASLSEWALFRGWSSGNTVTFPGRGPAQSFRLDVSPQFFRTIGGRVLDGREFRTGDVDANPRPVVVNAAFARWYLDGLRAVGQRFERSSRGQTRAYEIVGVVADTRDGSVKGDPPKFMFFPSGAADGTLEIRSHLDPGVLASLVRRELPAIHPSLRLVDVTRQTALVANTLLRERLLAVLSGFFGCVGLTLAAVGLYGVSSYAVAQRVREIGIRMALGASRAVVVRAVLGRLAAALAVGVAAGLGAGLYAAGFVRTLLFEIEPLDAGTLALSAAGFVTVALIAAWRPARRATRIDPVDALRAD